jgi:aerobic carbon-monoxide dehydrogenase small subunit
MMEVSIRVNGEMISQAIDDRLSLADFVREQCLLTGTHIGCEHGVCGACTLMMDGRPVRSCITLAAAADRTDVRTVEGYADDPLMDAIRRAFNLRHALQCGFCTPGMLATAYDVLSRIPDLDRDRIRVELGGNLCRCTGYLPIIQAIADVHAERRAGQQPGPIENPRGEARRVSS